MKIGEVQVAQRDLASALKAYRDGFAIFDRLAKSDPTNASRMHRVAGAYNYIGKVQLEQGDFAAALESYRAAVGILERLAKSDPSNVGWQSNLVENYAKLADVYRQSNDPNGALAALQRGQAIMTRLVKLSPEKCRLEARSGALRPTDRGADEISHSRLGPEGQMGHLITNALARPFPPSPLSRLADLGGKANYYLRRSA